MKRKVYGLLLTALVFNGCSCGDDPPGEPAPMDASVALPDAMVIVPADAGNNVELPVPTITSISPSSGSERGGTRVTIRGTSFTEPATVTFDDLPATSVVVLDEVSVSATTPPHAPGMVTVKVTTAGGTAELPAAFRYHRELIILAISPQRIPEEGGVPVSITGKGFDDNTIVLFDRKPLIGARLIDAEHIEGFAPALEPGHPEIRALHTEADTRRSDLLTVYATPDVRALAPGYGPIAGGSLQTLAGDGFENAERVVLSGANGRELSIESGERLSFRSPALAAGSHDVRVENADAAGELEGAYVAFDPANATFEVLGVSPKRVSNAGGDVIAIVGHGIIEDTTVAIGGIDAVITEIRRPNVILAVVPMGLSVGSHTVEIASQARGATSALADGLIAFAPITVDAIEPAVGPASGGTEVTITGSGFVAGVEVRAGDLQLTDVVVVSPTQITGVTVAGAHGAQDVSVKSGDTRGVLRGGFRFEEAYAIIRIDPVEGAIAGNTYVSVFGRGIDAPVAVKFGGVDGLEPLLENGSVIGVRTAPAPTGTVDVEVTTAHGAFTFEQAFTFYDPRLITGGAWGGPIEGAVNVAVLDPNSGSPMPGIVVQLGYDADPRYARLTDENGIATISSPEIRGAQTITAGQNGVEFVTFLDLDAKNLTVFASRYVSTKGPCPPDQMGVRPPRIRGRIFKFKSSLDPVTNPGWVPIVQVTYTQRNVFNANPPDPLGLTPSQIDVVTMDGGEYDISVLRVGTIAVYAILYDFHQATQRLIPRKMGIARQVPAAIETITEPIDISLDIDLTEDLVVTLVDPPMQIPGPTLSAVFPSLNLQSEGVIPFRATSAPSGTVVLTNLPDISASSFYYMGGSFTLGAGGALQSPYSLTLVESGAPFSEGLELGPFLQMPQNVEPKAFEFIENGQISWEQGGTTPDLALIGIYDFPYGECCLDAPPDGNGNGECEDDEPVMGGNSPVPVNRWSVFAAGGLETYTLPRMLSGINAFASPGTYGWYIEEAIAPRFDFREFIWNQFSQFFWQSWNSWGSVLTTKEEAP